MPRLRRISTWHQLGTFVLAAATWALLGPSTASSAPLPSGRSVPDRRKCGFAPSPFHTVVARQGLSWVQAKAALRRLRGSHDLAPVACGRKRRVDGWWLRNLVRDPSLAVTRYSRAGRSFDFARHQFPGNIWCPAPR